MKLESRYDMNIVIAGHVDHGKSTVLGRMLADTHSLPKGKLEQIKEKCRRNSKPFEYAFLLDALKDEQAQGITIDVARCFFKTDKRDYIIIDAPGHIEFIKNMVTGASRAEAAFLVIDAKEGIMENSKRHGYLLAMLGIKQLSVIINKMDLIEYNQNIYNSIVSEYTGFLKKIGLMPKSFIPVSGMAGDNIVFKDSNMHWYKGKTVLEQMDSFENEKLPEDKPFRMPVQGVYKFSENGDERRIVAGTVETGKISVGDEVVFYPSGKKSRIKSFEVFNSVPPKQISASMAAGFTLDDQIYITRGEVAVKSQEDKPKVTTRIDANIFWLGKNVFTKNKKYYLKLGTQKVGMKVEKIVRVLDTSNLNNSKKEQIERHEVAQCILKLDKAISFDCISDISSTSRFVIVDDYEIAGGGIIKEALDDETKWVRKKVLLRNNKWEKSKITNEERALKYNQKATYIIITGHKDTGKKKIAKALEKKLFNEGKLVYFMGITNVLYGVDADIKIPDSQENREEQLRRMAEVANLMTDAGLIVISTAINVSESELQMIKETVGEERIIVVWIGDKMNSNLPYDLLIENVDSAVGRIKYYIQEKGRIFKP